MERLFLGGNSCQILIELTKTVWCMEKCHNLKKQLFLLKLAPENENYTQIFFKKKTSKFCPGIQKPTSGSIVKNQF